jgi:hypothetical protein
MFFVEGDAKFAFAKATQLPSIIEAEKLCLRDEKKRPHADRMTTSAQHAQYYQVNSSDLFNLVPRDLDPRSSKEPGYEVEINHTFLNRAVDWV